jgi:hypothetical protein
VLSKPRTLKKYDLDDLESADHLEPFTQADQDFVD